MDLMVTNFHKTNLHYLRPPMGFTENRSRTFLSTGNPCLDFFFQVVPDTPPQSLIERLRLAWAHNPVTTLKLVCNLRGVRGTGKSDREGFYTAALWLHKYHPKTVASNVGSIAGFGYFKDLLEILYRLLEGPDVRRIQNENWEKIKDSALGRRDNQRDRRAGARFNYKFWHQNTMSNSKSKSSSKQSCSGKVNPSEDKRLAMAKKVLERYDTDPDFQFLYEKVSDQFAECLNLDIGWLKSSKDMEEEHEKKKMMFNISLAAKWCPSLDSSFDRSTLLCERIARKMFPRETCPEYQGIEESPPLISLRCGGMHLYLVEVIPESTTDLVEVRRVRDRLRKQVLVPLRKALELPEVYIGANQWYAIPYNRVASVAMKMYKDKFLERDRIRFLRYLGDVKQGKSKIAAGALLPHDIIRSLEEEEEEDCSNGDQVAELQWKRMVEDLSKRGKLNNCLAICDVSGSMTGTPMDVSVALGLLVSELSEESWKGKLITFSENPELHIIPGNDLQSKIEFVRDMEWGMNTDFQKVFDLILQVAVNGNLKEEDMIKRVFVFSDMEFDQASLNSWETDYEVITRKFSENGYGKVVPEIVFWNLRNSMSTPVMGTQKGVALVSGFSKNLMKLFLDNSGEIDPERVMEAAISGDEYQSLVVVD
ncbi:von Willebrand factor, type A [Parasponia andersonii]|uniref:von Willebrand factor, type A n=1 Tax=Parasponia andersonii TaxID=3476 RepID=A0A2P5BT36_PARAD|nr:von Willebrand factor, type A [Parasponia andersonii]